MRGNEKRTKKSFELFQSPKVRDFNNFKLGKYTMKLKVQRRNRMRHSVVIFFIALFFLAGCSDEKPKYSGEITNYGVDELHVSAIKEVLLKGKYSPKEYREISWKRLQSSFAVSDRIKKKALFISHTFREKNIYGADVTKVSIFFIGDGKPSKIIDFDVKNGLRDFVGNVAIQTVFAQHGIDTKPVFEAFQKGMNEPANKERIKAFVYSISTLPKEDKRGLDDGVTSANTPMTIANNVSLFMTMSLFPELIEELLYGEINYLEKR